MGRVKYILFVLLFCFFSVSSFAGGQGEYYLEEEVTHRSFEQKEWTEATEGLDYAEKSKKKKNREMPSFRPGFNIASETGKMIMKGLIILLAIVVLSLILKSIFSAPANKKIKKDKLPVFVELEKIEGNILETDFEKYINKALEQNNYALAIRLYFLAVLKELSLKNVISWKKDKTNRDYLREMRKSVLFGSFREITGLFELIWYGKGVLTAETYHRLEPHFRQFLEQVNDLNRS